MLYYFKGFYLYREGGGGEFKTFGLVLCDSTLGSQ